MEENIKDYILNKLLEPNRAMPEASARHTLQKCGWQEEEIQKAFNDLQGENKIRWVAFEGWCLGGRPT